MRVFAQIISVLFHPLLGLTYMLLLLLLINPYLFGVNSVGDSKTLILLIFSSTFLIPAFAVGMMKMLGLIETLEMKERQERIGPYIITGVFYLWMFRNFLDNPEIPTAYTSFVLGPTIALFVAFFINNFSKISIHAVGMGGLVGMIVITMLLFSYGTFTIDTKAFGVIEMSVSTLLMISIILTGLVGTCRLLLKAHHPRDLIRGFLVGFATQFIALRFLF